MPNEPAMPQQVEFEGLDRQFGDQLQCLGGGADGVERLLVAMAVQQRASCPASPSASASKRPASRSLSTNSSKSCACAGQRLVAAPGSIAGNSSRRVNRHEGSRPTIGVPAATSRRERVEHASRLVPRLVDEAGGEKGSAAAQRPAARGSGAITR